MWVQRSVLSVASAGAGQACGEGQRATDADRDRYAGEERGWEGVLGRGLTRGGEWGRRSRGGRE